MIQEEAIELIVDDAQLVHLEQHRVGRAPQALTPVMPPDRLLALLEGMGLALNLDRRLAPPGLSSTGRRYWICRSGRSAPPWPPRGPR